jgi:hypothetical protein
LLPAATTPVMCPTARIRISSEKYPDPKIFCLRPPQQAKGQQRPNYKCIGIFWSARVPLTGTDHRRRDQHLGERRGAPHHNTNATRVAARKMMAYVIGGETAEPASKRARLESVLPVRPTPPWRPNLRSLRLRRRPSRCRPRSGCPASCRPISTPTCTREASSAGDEAATSREEASKDRRGRPRPGAETRAGPEAADPAAVADGEASQDS